MFIEDEPYLRSAVSTNVLANSRQDKAQCRKAGHKCETDGTIPQVEDLGQGHVNSSSHYCRYNADEGDEGVRLEVTRDVGRQGAVDGLVEAIDEVQKPHPTGMLTRSFPTNKGPPETHIA